MNLTPGTAPRFAVYARVSSDLQDTENSLARQLQACRKWAESRGGVIPENLIFTDEAISGATLAARDGLQRLLSAVGKRGRAPFEAVLIDDPSRIDRGGNLASLTRLFAARSVSLISVDSGRDLTGEDERLLVHVQSGIGEFYLAELARRTRAGMAQRVLNGWHAGGRVFGYRLIPVWPEGIPPEQRSRDNRLGTRIEVEEEQAAVVRLLFERFATGVGTKTLAHDLNEGGVKSPRATTWDASAVRAILQNPKYRGDWSWNRSRWTKRPEDLLTPEEMAKARATGRAPRQRAERPPADLVQVQRNELRLVSDATWEAAQDRFRERAGQSNRRPTKSALSGLLVCSCGGAVIQNGTTFAGIGYKYLECSWRRTRGPTVCGNSNRFRSDRIFAEVLDWIKASITPEEVWKAAKTVSKAWEAEAKKARKPEVLHAAQEKVKELEAAKRRLTDAIAQGVPVETIRDAIVERSEELRVAKAGLKSLEAQAAGPGRWEPATADEIRERIHRLHEDLASTDSRARAAFRTLIQKILVEPIDGDWGQGWQLTIEARPWILGAPSDIESSGGGI